MTIVPGMCHELSRPLVVLDGSLTREGKPLISISPRVSVCGIRSSQSHFVRNRKANAAQQLSVLDLVPLSSHHSQDDTRSRKCAASMNGIDSTVGIASSLSTPKKLHTPAVLLGFLPQDHSLSTRTMTMTTSSGSRWYKLEVTS